MMGPGADDGVFASDRYGGCGSNCETVEVEGGLDRIPHCALELAGCAERCAVQCGAVPTVEG